MMGVFTKNWRDVNKLLHKCKNLLANLLLGNFEIADIITPHITQLKNPSLLVDYWSP